MNKGKFEQYNLPVQEKHFDNAAQVVAGLYNLKRTGWVDRGVANPETVGEHTDAMRILAGEIVKKLPSETQKKIDTKKLERMIQVHDWPEHHDGDKVVAREDKREEEKLTAKKRISEEKAMRKICARIGPEGKINLDLWLEFEEGKTLEGNLAKQIDKLQAMIKAWEYEQKGEPVKAMDFINHDRHKITEPVLIDIMKDIEKQATINNKTT